MFERADKKVTVFTLMYNLIELTAKGTNCSHTKYKIGATKPLALSLVTMLISYNTILIPYWFSSFVVLCHPITNTFAVSALFEFTCLGSVTPVHRRVSHTDYFEVTL